MSWMQAVALTNPARIPPGHSVRAKLDRVGIHCVSYSSATIKDDPDLENALRFAKILGAQNISGDATGGILGRIDQRCSQEGLKLRYPQSLL